MELVALVFGRYREAGRCARGGLWVEAGENSSAFLVGSSSGARPFEAPVQLRAPPCRRGGNDRVDFALHTLRHSRMFGEHGLAIESVRLRFHARSMAGRQTQSREVMMETRNRVARRGETLR
jgi:hypothetical protein